GAGGAPQAGACGGRARAAHTPGGAGAPRSPGRRGTAGDVSARGRKERRRSIRRDGVKVLTGPSTPAHQHAGGEEGSMRRWVLGGVLFLATSLTADAGGFAPAGAGVSGADAAVAARHGPAQILSRRHGTALSLNWAGNAASGTPFTHVKGTWTEPAVTCSKNQVQIASFWVGIDGFTSNTVE